MTTPRLDKVTLRAGTRYCVELADGTLSGERSLDEDLEVHIIVIGVTINVYEAVIDGIIMTILTHVNDEVR